MRFTICMMLCVSLSLPLTALAAPAADLETRRKALNDLLAEQWEYNMRTSPIYASILGDKRYNDKVDDFSQKAIDDGPGRRQEVPGSLRSDRHHRISRARDSRTRN